MTAESAGGLVQQQPHCEVEKGSIEYPPTMALLKRLQEAFPMGVPFPPPEQLWFVVPSTAEEDAGADLSEEESLLLRQAVEKGLNRSWSDVRVMLVDELIGHLGRPSSSGFRVIFLGGDVSVLEKAVKDKLPRERVITTVLLSEILQNPANKRVFWEDIRSLALRA